MASKPTTKQKQPAQTSAAKVVPNAKTTNKVPTVAPAGKSAAKTPAASKPPTAQARREPVDKGITKKQKPVNREKTVKGEKSVKREKTVRDSFNMPADDYTLIGTLKKRALASGREMKKSELLRAGVKALAGMNDAEFARALGAVPAIKTGRPAKKRE